MSLRDSDVLSLRTLIRRFWKQVVVTWGLTLIETAGFASMPLVIGWSIDGLLTSNPQPFYGLIGLFAIVLFVAITRRAYDTRAYGTMRVHLGKVQAMRRQRESVSVINARVLMGRELVDFLEQEAPVTMTAFVQVIASVAILFSFHAGLALSAGGSAIVILLIYAAFARLFFRLNRAMNEQSEKQVHALEGRTPKEIAAHFVGLRQQEVRISDAESLVYGLIFAVLLSMLGFNLWFAATQIEATPGKIFSIVTYSLEFLESSVMLPAALQSLTRLNEITERINDSKQVDALSEV